MATPNTDPSAAQYTPGPNGSSSTGGETQISSDAIPTSESLYQEDNNYGNLYYPEDIGKTPNQDYVYITQYRYKSPDFLSVGGNNGDINKILSGYLSTFQDIAYTDVLGSVTLPMVNNLTETNQTGWGSDNLSSIAAALMTGGAEAVAKAGGGDIIGSAGELIGTLKDTLTNTGVEGRTKTYLTTRAAASVIQKIGIQINPESYITRATGTIPNPNLELLFNGPKLRSFEMAFKLTPRSSKEAFQIRKIIKFFKKGMSPRRSLQSEQSFFLGTPNVFKVQFKSAENNLGSLVEYKTCALVTCQVNYTPDGFYAAYIDPNTGSQPIAVTLQLGFAELTPVYNDQYNLNSDTVGPDRGTSKNPGFEAFQYEIPERSTTTPPTSTEAVSGNPSLNQRSGRAPVLGGEGTARRAGEQGVYSEWNEKFLRRETTLTFQQYKQRFYPNLP
jgi:hypothetical protein